jgi:site-specific recombinase XerD
MVHLLYTTTDFKPEGIPSPNVPLLLGEEMELIKPVCLWFFHIALIKGRTRSPNTWRSYAEALYDWFQTCSVNNWQWDSVADGQLAAYRNHMLSMPSSYTGRPFSIRTINGRLRRIVMFYRWCLRKGIISKLPFDYEEVQTRRRVSRNILSHTDAHPGMTTANVLTVPEHELLPHALTADELREIYRYLCLRDKLIVQWSVTTGLRQKEVLGLTHHQIPLSKRLINNGKLIAINITLTKGNKPRNIYPSLRLLDRTNDYICEERSAIIRRQRNTPGYAMHSALWLTQQGKPVSKSTINKNYRAACKKAGSKAKFHDLRHTYAINMLANLQRQVTNNPEIMLNPLKALQVLLGHAHLSTTEIYLQALALNMESIEDSVQALYEELI